MKNLTKNDCINTPSAFITVGKKRVKQFNDIVYLNDGEEFEIEFFNPTNSNVLATIEMNGSCDGFTNGLVLRPGQRVFLDRFTSEPKKFLFSLYKIDKTDTLSLLATKDNGVVKISFYNAKKTDYTYYKPYKSDIQFYSNNVNNSSYNTSDSSTTYRKSNTCDVCADSFYDNTTYTTNTTKSPTIGFRSCEKEDSLIDTGRIESGGYSDQKFEYTNMEFNTYPMSVVQWNILPISQRNYEKGDLVLYCSNCGSKRKKQSFKFCPYCGNTY